MLKRATRIRNKGNVGETLSNSDSKIIAFSIKTRESTLSTTKKRFHNVEKQISIDSDQFWVMPNGAVFKMNQKLIYKGRSSPLY